MQLVQYYIRALCFVSSDKSIFCDQNAFINEQFTPLTIVDRADSRLASKIHEQLFE